MSTEEILDDADYFTWVFLPALFKVIKCSTEDLSQKTVAQIICALHSRASTHQNSHL